MPSTVWRPQLDAVFYVMLLFSSVLANEIVMLILATRIYTNALVAIDG